MWMILVAIAAAAALCNVIWMVRGKDTKWFRFISLSFTALALCACYGVNAKWVSDGDWSALLDVTPTVAKCPWVCTVISISVNGVSLLKKS